MRVESVEMAVLEEVEVLFCPFFVELHLSKSLSDALSDYFRCVCYGVDSALVYV